MFCPWSRCTSSGSKDESTAPTTTRKRHRETKWNEVLREKDILRCLFKIWSLWLRRCKCLRYGVSCSHYCYNDILKSTHFEGKKSQEVLQLNRAIIARSNVMNSIIPQSQARKTCLMVPSRLNWGPLPHCDEASKSFFWKQMPSLGKEEEGRKALIERYTWNWLEKRLTEATICSPSLPGKFKCSLSCLPSMELGLIIQFVIQFAILIEIKKTTLFYSFVYIVY